MFFSLVGGYLWLYSYADIHGWTSMVLTCTDENSDESFAVTGGTLDFCSLILQVFAKKMENNQKQQKIIFLWTTKD